jgi:hypothetical protein
MAGGREAQARRAEAAPARTARGGRGLVAQPREKPRGAASGGRGSGHARALRIVPIMRGASPHRGAVALAA